MSFFLGIDLGTSYFKAGVFDGKGNLRGLGRQVVNKETGEGTVCELPVAVFWRTLHTTIGEAVKNANIAPGEIRAVSYSSQANSFILLDSKDEPLTPLILWPDKRAEKNEFPLWNLTDNNEFLEKTGLGFSLNSQFAIAKISWIQNKQPKIWEQVNSILSISDYLTFKLTGQKISDVSTASMTGLLDVTKCRWWNSALKAFSIDAGSLFTPQRIGSSVGKLTKTGAQLIGLSSGTSYYLGGLDHHCAAIGSGITQNNTICESTGTVLSCVGYAHKYDPGMNYCTAPGLSIGQYFQMAFNDNGALSLEWYQRMFAPDLNISELLKMAEDVKKGCDGLAAKPCANKYQGLSGFENIKPFHQHGHFIRALLESTSESLSVLSKLLKKTDFSDGIISTGGGAQSTLWVKIKADKLSTDFYIPECSETACMGAAMIGAVGNGDFGSWNELAESWIRFKTIVRPFL